MLDNFSNAPVSIGEARAEKERSSAYWTPREALLSMLRSIDRQEINPSSIVIIFDVPAENGELAGSTYYVAAVKGFHKAIGLLTYARHLMMRIRD